MDVPQRSVVITVTLPQHTSDTFVLIKAARLGLAEIRRDPIPDRPAWRYPKAGVMTNDLAPQIIAPER